MCKTSYLCFCIYYTMLGLTNLISILHHAGYPFYPACHIALYFWVNTPLFSVSMCLFFVLFIQLFCFTCLFVYFLYSIHKWSHMGFTFIYLTYYSYYNSLKVHSCWRRWSWTVLWGSTRPSRTNIQKEVLFIIGDWNAKVGSQEIPGVTGKFGIGVQNEAGKG